MVSGLDMRFLGRKGRNKNISDGKGNRISRFSLGLCSCPSTLLRAEWAARNERGLSVGLERVLKRHTVANEEAVLKAVL